MTNKILRLLGACLCLLPLALQAQSLPKPKEFYFDEDASTARPIVLFEGRDDAAIQRLMRARERSGRDSAAATAQLAHIAYDTGRIDTGEALYQSAYREVGAQGRLHASLLWNHGWDLFRAGDAEGALARWREGGIDRFGNPAWVPPTVALALWTLDRRQEAVDWYAAAVRTEPRKWRDPANLPALLPEWRPEDLAVLADVAAAWAADPPAWP
jgi:tetratricopeptide (TPR) repeat protein